MVIARPITGTFRSIKSRINVVLFAIFFALPFIQIAGNPLILLDIPGRKFHIFGLTIWPQELHFLHIILLSLGLMLFFFTALSGRIWCAYACPQTIFIEMFNGVGRLVGGKKFGKKTATTAVKARVWLAWLVVAVVTGFTFVSYFKGPYVMFENLANGNVFAHTGSLVPATWVLFWIAATTFALVAFGWLRENACKIICPYGRFQTAMLDKHSPIVTYNETRGEPRRQKGVKVDPAQAGDCTACNWCLLVCPTGIDIREGLQVGCIRCGLCVDACTIEMGKHNKETLIDLKTIAQAENPAEKRRYVRPRTLVYGTGLLILAITFGTLLFNRVPLYTSVLREKSMNSVFIPGVGYQNMYELRIGNMSNEEVTVKIDLAEDGYQLVNDQQNFKLPPSGFEKLRFIVRYPSDKKMVQASKPITFTVQNINNQKHSKKSESLFSFSGS